MGKRLDIEPGQKFGRLTIIRETQRRAKKRYFLCRCDCGNERTVRLVAMRAGEVKSCGCLRNEQNRVANMSHGLWGTSLYWSWHSMKDRCLNPNCAVYKHYGARGIAVCDDWMGFEAFRDWALSNSYKEGLTIERIDVNGNYEPDNCTWIPMSEQSNNKRSSRIITFRDKTMNLKKWADHLGLRPSVLWGRLDRGWSVEKAFTTPLQNRYSRGKTCLKSSASLPEVRETVTT